MIAILADQARTRPWLVTALALALGGVATILGAFFFEYVVRLPPCPLCLEQRVPYYVMIPVALAVAAATMAGAPGLLVRLGLVALAGLMVWAAALGVYHAGAEWAFWQGPATCAQPATIARTPGDLLRQIQTGPRPVDCTVAAWRFLGLSLAGWNAVVATILAALALFGASRRPQAA